MERTAYLISNSFMHLLHFALIGFATFGWAFAELRPWHLALQGGILVSWVGYGVVAGRWAHCAITEWHWGLKERWTARPETESFIDYWLRYKWRLTITSEAITRGAIGIYAVATLLSAGFLVFT